MSNLPISSKYRSKPGKPVDADERESVVARVNQAFEDGVLDDVSYRTCLDATFAAATLGELLPVIERLPAIPTHNVPAIVEAGGGRPGEVTSARAPSNKGVLVSLGVGGIAIVVLIVLLVLLLP